MMRVGIEKLIRDSFRIQHTTQIMKANDLPLKNALGLALKEDSFLKTEETEGGLYSPNRKSLRTKAVPDSIIDIINFHPFDSENYVEKTDRFVVYGKDYLFKDLPSVDPNRAREIKAVNNEIVFEQGAYYKFTSTSGEERVLGCRGNGLYQLTSDLANGRRNEENYIRGRFWTALSDTSLFIYKYCPEETQKQWLEEAGIQKGFFSVKFKDRKREYFYSDGNCGVAVPKSHYDSTYMLLTSPQCCVFDGYEPGDIFKIGDKEYVLTNDRRLDIAYGDDIMHPIVKPQRTHQDCTAPQK